LVFYWPFSGVWEVTYHKSREKEREI